MFPTPRTQRVSPGHLVAIASDVVVWRWYDAVVLGEEAGSVRLWEPAHGEVEAERRSPHRSYRPGTRAYVSNGLPGAQWWIAGPVVDDAGEADVELDEVDRFFTERDLWPAIFTAP